MQALLSEIILGMCFYETVTLLYNSSFFQQFHICELYLTSMEKYKEWVETHNCVKPMVSVRVAIS